MPGKRMLRLYYAVKPVLPRSVQILLRRRVARRKYFGVWRLWPLDPRAGEAPPGWRGWPDGRKFALVLTHDVELDRGMERCLRVASAEARLGLVSSFHFVPEHYRVSADLRRALAGQGFEIGVHDLRHDGRLYESKDLFLHRAQRINMYLREWNAVGFRSASMQHNLEWLRELRIEWDSSTFDTDPFEPQPDGLGRIYPLLVPGRNGSPGYVELPYTIPQDLTLFVVLGLKDTSLWREKLDWLAERGGMALVDTHPDYMRADGERPRVDEYPQALYEDFLRYVVDRYRGRFWNAVPRDVARFWRRSMG